MTNANIDSYFDDGIEVRVAQLPKDYSANEAGLYFDSAPSGYMIASDSIDDSCLTYPEASEGMINIGIACATFKSTSQRVCALSEDLATEGSLYRSNSCHSLKQTRLVQQRHKLEVQRVRG